MPTRHGNSYKNTRVERGKEYPNSTDFGLVMCRKCSYAGKGIDPDHRVYYNKEGICPECGGKINDST